MSGMIKCAPYEGNEEAAIKELDAATQKAAPGLERYFSQLSYVYEENKEALGRITGEIFCDTMEIKFLVVRESERRKGIGKQLICAIEEDAARQGCRHVTLETMSFNSWEFYLAAGYEVLAEIKDSPMPGATHYFLHKAL